MLGVLSVSAVAFVGLLIGAVTFLGTSSEQRFTPVGSSLGEDPYEDPYEDPSDDPSEDPYEEPATDPTAVVLEDLTDVLADDAWTLEDQYLMTADEPLASAPCAPEGWQTGALDRAIGMFRVPGAERESPLTITLVAYETEADAAAELERARTTTYQDCEVLQRREQQRLGSDVEVAVLPEDAAAPGVAIAMAEIGGAARTEYDHVIVVGRMRAQIDVCDCAGLDQPALQLVAVDVAAAMAEQQGLPVPG